MLKKWITLGIIFLFIGASIPGLAYSNEKTISSTFNGNWLYVGGSGPGNYSKIQDAINDSSDGDTVFVFDDSSPYNEFLRIINKQVSLLGENRNTTIISEGIYYTRNESMILGPVTIEGFTIKGSNDLEYIQNLTLANNNLNDGFTFLKGCSDILISSNFFHHIQPYQVVMLLIDSCSNVRITGNTFFGVSEGGLMGCSIGARNCLISENRFINLSYGVSCGFCINVTIMRNSFIDNRECILVGFSLFTKVLENNFLNTSKYPAICAIGFGNVWDRNYWGRPRLLPQPIYAFSGYYLASIIHYLLDMGGFNISWSCYYIPIVYKYDWHPAQEPYDIPRMI